MVMWERLGMIVEIAERCARVACAVVRGEVDAADGFAWMREAELFTNQSIFGGVYAA